MNKTGIIKYSIGISVLGMVCWGVKGCYNLGKESCKVVDVAISDVAVEDGEEIVIKLDYDRKPFVWYDQGDGSYISQEELDEKLEEERMIRGEETRKVLESRINTLLKQSENQRRQ